MALDSSFRALSGSLKFTVRRYKFNNDSLCAGDLVVCTPKNLEFLYKNLHAMVGVQVASFIWVSGDSDARNTCGCRRFGGVRDTRRHHAMGPPPAWRVLSHTLTHSHTHILPHSRTLTLSHSHALTLSHSHTSHTHTLAPSHTRRHHTLGPPPA